MSFHRISESGSFTGNGSAGGQTVTLGWQPAFVMVGALKTSGGNASTRGYSLKIADMPDSSTFYLRSSGISYETSGGITITSTGFTVGNQAIHNASGVTIAWWAIRDAPGFVEHGSYVGEQASGDLTPKTITLSDTANKSLVMVVRPSTTAGQFAERCASKPAENCWVLGTASRTGIVAPSPMFQFSGNTFTVGNDGTNCLFNMSGETYYYLVIHASEGGSDGSTSFGSTRIYHADSRNASSIPVEVTTGLPTKQCWCSQGGRNSFGFDPMPADGWFASSGAGGFYQTQAELGSGTIPTRSSTGYNPGSIGAAGIAGDAPEQNTLLFHY